MISPNQLVDPSQQPIAAPAQAEQPQGFAYDQEAVSQELQQVLQPVLTGALPGVSAPSAAFDGKQALSVTDLQAAIAALGLSFFNAQNSGRVVAYDPNQVDEATLQAADEQGTLDDVAPNILEDYAGMDKGVEAEPAPDAADSVPAQRAMAQLFPDKQVEATRQAVVNTPPPVERQAPAAGQVMNQLFSRAV